MSNKINCAVIGVGNMGKNHARIYSRIAKLTAVADPAGDAGQKIAKAYSCLYYQDYREMLKKENLEAVSVVVPTKFHEEVAIHCLKSRIPTLLEKPISNSLESAEKILSQAKKSRTLLMIGHVERFNPAVLILKKLISKKKFGRIISLNSIRVGINPPATKGSDVALDLAIHDIDIFNYLLEETPLESTLIKGKIFKDNLSDHASILLRYKEASGIIQTNWMTPVKIRKLYVTGINGFAELDYITQKLILYEHPKRPKIHSGFKELQSLVDAPKKQVFVSTKEPLREEISHFLKMVKQKRVVYPNFAINALKVALS